MKKRIKKGKRNVKERQVIPSDNHATSDSHAIEIEIRRLKKGVKEANREYHETRGPSLPKRIVRHKITPTLIFIWLIISLIFASLLTTSVATFLFIAQPDRALVPVTTHIEDVMVTDITQSDMGLVENVTLENMKEQEKYYGVMLGRFKSSDKEYYAGEEAQLTSLMILNEVEDIDATAHYELIDPENRSIYSYEDDVYIYGNNSKLRKSILLTENYPEGDYRVDFIARFNVEGKKYMLPGSTGFKVKERPKPSFSAALGRELVGLGWLNKLLLVLVMILNLLLIYNSWLLDKEE